MKGAQVWSLVGKLKIPHAARRGQNKTKTNNKTTTKKTNPVQKVLACLSLRVGLKNFPIRVECAGFPCSFQHNSSLLLWCQCSLNSLHCSKMNLSAQRTRRQATFSTTELNLYFKLPFYQAMETQSQDNSEILQGPFETPRHQSGDEHRILTRQHLSCWHFSFLWPMGTPASAHCGPLLQFWLRSPMLSILLNSRDIFSFSSY